MHKRMPRHDTSFSRNGIIFWDALRQPHINKIPKCLVLLVQLLHVAVAWPFYLTIPYNDKAELASSGDDLSICSTIVCIIRVQLYTD